MEFSIEELFKIKVRELFGDKEVNMPNEHKKRLLILKMVANNINVEERDKYYVDVIEAEINENGFNLLDIVFVLKVLTEHFVMVDYDEIALRSVKESVHDFNNRLKIIYDMIVNIIKDKDYCVDPNRVFQKIKTRFVETLNSECNIDDFVLNFVDDEQCRLLKSIH